MIDKHVKSIYMCKKMKPRLYICHNERRWVFQNFYLFLPIVFPAKPNINYAIKTLPHGQDYLLSVHV